MKNFSFIISIVLASVFNCFSQIEHQINENIALAAKNIIDQLNVKQGNKLVLVNSASKTKIVGYLKAESQSRNIFFLNLVQM